MTSLRATPVFFLLLSLTALLRPLSVHNGTAVPVSTATRNRHLACLKVVFKAAVDWNFAASNPADRVKMEREQRQIPDALTDPELATLLLALPDHIRAVAA